MRRDTPHLTQPIRKLRAVLPCKSVRRRLFGAENRLSNDNTWPMDFFPTKSHFRESAPIKAAQSL